MPSEDLLLLLDAALKEKFEFEPDAGFDRGHGDTPIDEDYLERLRFFFDDNLLLAALDLVDRDSVVKFNTSWGHTRYQVLGTTTTYSVFPGQTIGSRRIPSYCTCASFAFSVLVTDAQYMCKHLLAVVLALRLDRCLERTANPDDIAQICARSVS
ncbi:uncharacterized protein PHACADRAFT_209630 [Phanerochaete carnosa HHB-10118-sp]|uniref:SWIM-type domain-containing protein n=1 Tax=Phanerochaete carnosa (strain HHB-10118-sp) TaxID=650164 RepID=K5WAW8_PHACS|nr:uncharacterized protein PHACADRAFT_209630 [Phanerochaete carnosa HHB-10118-sp]EKM56134.1 hypothetical protein PHACADRAFT_209630 [Phanerochaete carnosa HHB-10118-sp]